MVLIATFGIGQKHEGTFVEINCESWDQADEYMQETYDGKYCFIYSKTEWESMNAEAKEKGLVLEKMLCSVNLGA